MNAQTLLQTVIALFALSAVGGLTMLAIRLGKGHNPPAWLAMGHGFLAAAGLTLLVFGVLTKQLPALANLATLLLVGAALGGVVLNLGFDQKGKLLPQGLMWGHALLAVSGVVLLLLAAFP
jgi:uncharacterized membrane protein AbrB (regulator of aidB expression)